MSELFIFVMDLLAENIKYCSKSEVYILRVAKIKYEKMVFINDFF